MEEIGSKAFSNALVEILTGDSYFDVVGALATAVPNGAHQAIARLAGRGTFVAIVTTNFDTLIEQAMASEKVAADVYSRPRDYKREATGGVPVYKIHGTAGEEVGLIDTVGQKLRGLAPIVHDRLRDWFARYPVISIGYSGGDLEFGADYLSLRVIPTGSKRLWWIIRPEDRKFVEPTTTALVDGRGAFVAMPQSEVFESLGAGPVALPPRDRASTDAQVARLRSQASTLFKQHGSLNTLAFCMRLLSAAGRTQAAIGIWTFVAAEVERRKRQTVALVGPAMRALSAEGNRLVGVIEQETWACRQLVDIRKRRDNPRAAKRAVKRRERDRRIEALAYLAIGDSKLRRARGDLAGLAMQRAMECCEETADLALLPGVYRLYGWRESERLQEALNLARPLKDRARAYVQDLIKSEDTALNYLQAAEAAGLLGGNVDAIASAWLRAEFFMQLGEYDAALLCLDRLADRSTLGVHARRSKYE